MLGQQDEGELVAVVGVIVVDGLNSQAEALGKGQAVVEENFRNQVDELVQLPVKELPGHLFLTFVVPVQNAFRHSRGGGDVLDGGTGQPLGGKQTDSRFFDNFAFYGGTGHSTSFLCERFFTSLGGQVKKKAGMLFPGRSGSGGVNEPWKLSELRRLLPRQGTALLQAPDRKCRTLRPDVPSPGPAPGRTGDIPAPCTFP